MLFGLALGALLLTIQPAGAQSNAPISVNYPENSTGAVGSPVYAQDPERRGVNWRVEGEDADEFDIMTNNNAGTLTFKDPPDFEEPQDADENNLYSVSVRAVDPGGRVSAARTFNVQVTNVEEPGMVTVSHNGDEPWYGGLQPQVDVQLLAYATDPDHIQDDIDTTVDDVTWQWYRGNQSSSVCSDSVSDNCLIEGADESAYTPVEGDVGMSLTAAASYIDKEDNTRRKSAASESTYVTQAADAAGANRLPTFEQDQTTLPGNTAGYGTDINTLIDLDPTSTPDAEVVYLEIQEDASIGDMVGPGPIVATDPDEGDELTYSIEATIAPTGTDLGPAQFFDIDRATGHITLKKKVDKEATGTPCDAEDLCRVTVTATDSSGVPAGDAHVQIDLRIEIINVNELPMVTGDNAVSIDENTTDIDADGETTGPQEYTATDIDNEVADLTWSLSGADAGLFAFGTTAPNTDPDITVPGNDPEAGDLQFITAPDFEDPKDANKDNTYEVTLNVSDGTGTTTKEVKVTVKNLVTVGGAPDGAQEEAGTVTLSHVQPRVGVPFVATLKDDDGGIRSASWQWSITGATGTDATPTGPISGATSASYTPKAGDVGGTLTATVTYLDSTSMDQTQTRTATETSASAVFAAIQNDNRPTFAEGRYAREVAENAPTAVTNPVDGGDAFIAVTDEDADDLVQFSISGADSEYFTVTNPSDNKQAVITPKSALNYEAPKDADRNNIYVFALIATDSARKTGSTTVSVTVTDLPEDLEAGDPPAGMTVEENSPLRTNIGMPIQPEDSGDSTYQTYELLDGTDGPGDSAYFRIHRDDGQVYVNKELDYEARPTTICGNNECSVNVEITGWKTDDEGNTVEAGQDTTGEFDITITDVNEAPSYSMSQTRYVAENAWKLENEEYKRDTKTGKPATLGSTLVLVATDDDGTPPGLDLDLYRTTATATGDPVAAADQDLLEITDVRTQVQVEDRLLYTMSGPDAMYFGIYRATGQIITQGLLDFESLPASKKYFTVQVTATDRAGLSDTTDVKINVVDVNEPPLNVIGLSVSGQSSLDYAENGDAAIGTYEVEESDAATANWSVAGADGSQFMVAPTSGMSTMLSFRSSPDYEAPADADGDNEYMVTISVTSGGEMSSRPVTVTVTNAEEDGMVAMPSTSPVVGGEVTATLTDPDGSISGLSWDWHTSSDMATWSAAPGTETNDPRSFTSTYTTVADDVDKYLRATASYTDGFGAGNSEQAVSAKVLAASVNVAPRFPTATTTRSIAENMANADIGDPIVADDPNGADDTLTYTLEGMDAASFSIVRTTGQLRTSAALDYEDKDTYTVVVRATDPAGLSDTIEVTINVTDVEEEVPMAVQDYDTDGTPGIQIDELFAAIDAYFDNLIDIDALFEIIDAYFG